MKNVLLVLAALGAGSSSPAIDVTISPLEVTVGDQIEMVVTAHLADSDREADLSFPDWGETLGTAEILRVGPVEALVEQGETVAYQQRLMLTFFTTGEMKLPPIDIRFESRDRQHTVTTPVPGVTVLSVLPEDVEQAEPKPPAPLRRLDLGSRFWWVAAALLLTCLAALLALRYLVKDLNSGDGFTQVAPMDEFRRALAALRAEGEVVALHAGLSLAVRRFLGRTLGFTAPESTTTEIRRQLRERQMPLELVRDVGDLLSSCDLVKFARRAAERAVVDRRIEGAQSIANGVSELLRLQADQEAATEGSAP